MADARCSMRSALTEAEARSCRIEPGYARASTASRLDAFLLPDSLQFAEYNAESPAGLGYTAGGSASCSTRSTRDGAFPRAVRARPITGHRRRCSTALLASYREWGGTASAADGR